MTRCSVKRSLELQRAYQNEAGEVYERQPSHRVYSVYNNRRHSWSNADLVGAFACTSCHEVPQLSAGRLAFDDRLD